VEEILTGEGTLTSDRTKESWVVSYTITHNTEVVTLTRHAVTQRNSVVAVRPAAAANFKPGDYTLETSDGEYVFLQNADGQWEIRL
jgi:hypothetical protein